MLQIHWHSKTWFKLRFSGFADEWNEDYLNKLFDNRNERNFESLEVLSVTINNGVLKRSDLGSDRKNKDKKSMKHVLKGDLVYNPMFMWKGASGISSYEGITSADYIVLKSKNNVNPIFFSHLFQTEKSLNKFKNYSQGSLLERLRLMYPQFSDIKMAFPSYEEQEKIANLLTFVDNKLELIEKKYQTYLDFKKYLMQQIFTQKLRFDFKDTWDKVLLKDVAFIPKKTKLTNVEGLKLLTVKLHTKGIEINDRIKPKLTKRGRPYYIRRSGELLIGRQNFHNGGMGIVPKLLDGGICSNAISSFNVFEDKIDVNYLYYFLARPEYYIKSERLIGGTGQKEFSEKELLKLKIDLPSLEEQNKIVDFLLNIDHKIELSENQLNKTQEFKKGLLQQMFVVRINWRCNFKLVKSPSFNKHLLILKNKIIFIIIK